MNTFSQASLFSNLLTNTKIVHKNQVDGLQKHNCSTSQTV